MRLDGHDAAAIDEAVALITAGELVAFPTETVYGLGARADSDEAVAKIFALKGRPSGHPLIVHVADRAGAERFAAALAPVAVRLVDAFWPGPLTVIVSRRPGVADAAAAGQGTIGLRCPAHPVAHALLVKAAQAGVPGIAAPSANRFGRVSPTTAAHVQQEFGPDLLVVDGGACDVGIESAIIDCTGHRPALLRPGAIDPRRFAEVLGRPLAAAGADAARAPGTLASHYAPDARLVLMDTAALDARLRRRPPRGLAVYSRLVPPPAAGVAHRPMPDSAAAVAHELFAVLRAFDAAGVSLIWVEQPPPGSDWDGVRDRLARAAAA
jgi:L-threonylcarbamoyladenylate synthase